MLDITQIKMPINKNPIKIRKINFDIALKLPKPSDWNKNINKHLKGENMFYTLVSLEKIKEQETFDRNLLIGETFIIDDMPVIGKSFYGIHGEKCLKTTKVEHCYIGGDWFNFETKNTRYKFELIK